MTPLRAKKLLPIITAFAEGKSIQFSYINREDWSDVENPDFSNHFDYRIKPTEPKLRPWRPAEVPVGAVVRHKETGLRMLIEGTNGDVAFMRIGYYSMEALLESWLYSIDFGKTWLPCGVMEDGQ